MSYTPQTHEDVIVTSQELLERAQVLYEFVDLFSQYESTPRNYGWTEDLTMNEVHLLAKIDTLVANVDARTGNDLFYLVLRLATKRTVHGIHATGIFKHLASSS